MWNTRQDLTTKFLYGSAFRGPNFGTAVRQSPPGQTILIASFSEGVCHCGEQDGITQFPATAWYVPMTLQAALIIALVLMFAAVGMCLALVAIAWNGLPALLVHRTS